MLITQTKVALSKTANDEKEKNALLLYYKIHMYVVKRYNALNCPINDFSLHIGNAPKSSLKV